MLGEIKYRRYTQICYPWDSSVRNLLQRNTDLAQTFHTQLSHGLCTHKNVLVLHISVLMSAALLLAEPAPIRQFDSVIENRELIETQVSTNCQISADMHYEFFLTKQDINTPVCRESEPKLTIAQIGNQISRPNRLNLNEEIGYPNHNFTKFTKRT